MKATAPASSGKLQIEDVPKPTPDDDELLIQTARSGICPTGVDAVKSGDTWGFDRPIGYPGHEFSGEVVEVGDDVEWFARGDRVAADLQLRCGDCIYCRNGTDNLCEDMSMTGYFSHAEYVLSSAEQTVSIPHSLADDTAALAEPVACVLHSVAQANITSGDTVLIVGAGQMGLLHQTVVSEYEDVNVIITDVLPERLERAAEFGADLTLQGGEDTSDQIFDYIPSGIDAAFVTVGQPPVQEQTVEMVGKTGTIVLYAGVHTESPPSIEVNPNKIHYDEIHVTGSSMRTLKEFEQALTFLDESDLEASDLVTHRFSLSEINQALDTISNRDGIKAMIEF